MNRPLVFSFALLATASLSFIPVKNKRYVGRTSLPTGEVYVIIDKSDYELKVYDDKGWYGTYPVVFGSQSQADKKMEGDRLTPEGTFRILSKRPHDKWSRFLHLNYPTASHKERFARLKASGQIPSSASIGGGIGIHGTWPKEDYAIDRYLNWTNGCISLKRKDVEALYEMLGVGTKVTIRK